MFNKENSICCCILTIIASLVFAAGIAAAFFTGIIASVVTLLVVTLVIGILSLLLIIFLITCNRGKACFCLTNQCIIISTVGSILASVFALSATSLATGSFAVAILIGTVAFFLISNLINLISFIICLLCSRRCD